MTKQGSRSIDPKKVSTELLSLTYGALVAQLLEDYDDDKEVNKQLEKMGYNIGIRIIEDFMARTNYGRCNDLKEVAEMLADHGFRMFLGYKAKVTDWSPAGDAFSLQLEQNPLTEFVELPQERSSLSYSNIICGVIRGALESVQIEALVSFVKDQLRGDNTTEIRVTYIQRLHDAIPAGEED